MIEVVNIKSGKGYEVYIGRPRKGSPPSGWQNDHDWKKLGRAEALRRYKIDLWRKMQDPKFCQRMLKELDGKRLGCFCKPLDCHGDILKAAVEWLKKNTGGCSPQTPALGKEAL